MDLVEYVVYIFTSNLCGAGTDSEVSLVLHGHDRDTSVVKLQSQPGSFRQGHTEVFRQVYTNFCP